MQMLRLIFVDSAERRLAPEAIELHDLLPPPRARTGADHRLAIVHTGTNATPSDAQESYHALLTHERFPVSAQFGGFH